MQQVSVDKTNVWTLVTQFLEIAQQRGKFSFKEAHAVKSAATDEKTAHDVLLQSLQLAQERGAYTLNDASNIFKLVEFVAREQESIGTPEKSEDEVSIGDEID